jgi:ParB family chromosome partitioning protein
MGHARALINIDNEDTQLDIYNQIVLNSLSVREVEDLARGVKAEIKTDGKTTKEKKSSKAALSVEQINFVNDLRAVFNTKVQISKEGSGKGKIVIPFKSENDLKRILDLLNA